MRRAVLKSSNDERVDWFACRDPDCLFWIHGEHWHVPKPEREAETVTVKTTSTEWKLQEMRKATEEHQNQIYDKMCELQAEARQKKNKK